MATTKPPSFSECDSIQRTRLRGLENKFLINIDHHLSGRPLPR